MTDDHLNCLEPVLVGGTGRSGSTVVGHLLDHHGQLLLTRPMEVRFITGNHGFADALAVSLSNPGSVKARAAVELAVDRLANRWYRRAADVGLHTSMTIEQIHGYSREYLANVAADPVSATRFLVHSIMAMVVGSGGRWVDTTPANARLADRVEPIYPDSRVIAVTRDGRDVATSFVSQTFGPDDVFEALVQWERRMLAMHKAQLASAPGRVLTIELMDLVTRDRLGTVNRICAFLNLPADESMLAWFDANVTEAGSNSGRWRSQLDSQTGAELDRLYDLACDRLRAMGVRVPTP